jgi:assimilatory nitrate reductase catalytic subunit
MSSAAAAGLRALVWTAVYRFRSPISAPPTLMLVGANVAETMPPLGRYLTEQRQRGST